MKRIFVFKDKVYLLSFTTEGFDQVENLSEGGSEKGDSDEEKKEKEMQDGNIEYDGKEGVGESKGDGEDKDKGQSSKGPQGSCSAPSGSRVAKRMLQFDDMELDNQAVTMECASLLKAMELDEEEEEAEIDATMSQGEEEPVA